MLNSESGFEPGSEEREAIIPTDEHIIASLKNYYYQKPKELEVAQQMGVNVEKMVIPEEAIEWVRALVYMLGLVPKEEINRLEKLWEEKKATLGKAGKIIGNAIGNLVTTPYFYRDSVHMETEEQRKKIRDKGIREFEKYQPGQ